MTRPLAQNVLKKEKKFHLCGEEGQVFDGENKG